MNPLASKYILVSNDLAARIQSGMYPAGSRRPAESQLIREYGVRRDTLRKALAVLEQEGYIQKARGREALVLDREKVVFPVSGLTSFQELAEAEGYHTRTEVVLLEYGENRCLPLSASPEGKTASQYADELNEQIGVTPDQQRALQRGFACGWKTGPDDRTDKKHSQDMTR